MFDFSFGELMLVALVALVVLGPERLPKAARFIGLWVRRARAQWYSVKSELEHELASDELNRSLRDGRDAMRDAEDQLRDLQRDIERADDPVNVRSGDRPGPLRETGDRRDLQPEMERVERPPAGQPGARND